MFTIAGIREHISHFSRSFASWHVLLRALILTILFQGFLWVLPAVLLGGHPDVTIPPPIFGIEQNIYLIVNTILITTPTAAMFLWFPSVTKQMATKLKSILQTDPGEYPSIYKQWHLVISIIIASVYVGIFIASQLMDSTDRVGVFEAVGTWAWIFTTVNIGVPTTILVLCIFWLIDFVRWFGKIVEPGLKVRPLDPDGCGGLDFIGNVFQRLTLFIVMIGLWLICMMWVGVVFKTTTQSLFRFLVVPGIIIYFVLAWFLAFAPIWLVHRKMVEFRNDILKEQSVLFERTLRQKKLKHKQRTTLLQTIKEQHDVIIYAHPVWPYTIPQWRGLRLFSLLPPVVAAIASVVEIIPPTG